MSNENVHSSCFVKKIARFVQTENFGLATGKTSFGTFALLGSICPSDEPLSAAPVKLRAAMIQLPISRATIRK